MPATKRSITERGLFSYCLNLSGAIKGVLVWGVVVVVVLGVFLVVLLGFFPVMNRLYLYKIELKRILKLGCSVISPT